MKPAFLLLAAAGLTGAAPPGEGAPYEAGGFEPSWTLLISAGRLTYDPGLAGVTPTSIPLPRLRRVRNGYRFVAPGLIVDIRHVRCESYAGRTFADTVTVSGVVEPGCGGRPIAPATLNSTGWELGSVDGASYRRGDVNLHFDYEGVLRGHAGCSTFTVPYTERRPFVRFGRMTVRRWDCPAGLGLEREQRVLGIFSGRSRVSFVDGDTLVLTGRHGTARLLP